MGKGESNNQPFLEQKSFGLKNEWLIYIGSVLSTLLFWQMVQNHDAVSIAITSSWWSFFLYIVYYAASQIGWKSKRSTYSFNNLNCLYNSFLGII